VHDIDVNAKSTLFMLQKIKELNLKCKFVLGSTFIVIGKPERLPVNEKSICNPTTIYGANRLVSEYYCKIFNQVYGLDTLIFRITNSFGPREQIIKNKNAINYLIYEAFKGNKVNIYNDGNFYRDLIYISDVITGIKTIIKKGKKGNLYWISSNKKTWFHQLGNWLTQFSNVKVNYVNSPAYTQKVDVGNFVVDNSKLKLLGWKPKVSVKDGIKRTLEYFEDSNLK
jgi:nucleoside-diphosphate-sugar epimerase